MSLIVRDLRGQRLAECLFEIGPESCARLLIRIDGPFTAVLDDDYQGEDGGLTIVSDVHLQAWFKNGAELPIDSLEATKVTILVIDAARGPGQAQP